MNKNAKNELMFLMGLGAVTSLLLKQKKLSLGLTLGAAVLGLSKVTKPFSFRNRVVMITGGSRGLGLALAKRFVREGAYVSLLARDAKELERAKTLLLGFTSSDHILLCECDITDNAQLTNAFQKTMNELGDIDVLVNNAGAIIVGPFESMSLADFEAQIRLHLYANVNATQKILPIFRKKKGGRIVNICSMGGKVAVPHMLPYDTSKFALAGFSQGITAEFAKENIAVTTVYPTLMRTGSPIQAVFKGNAQKEFSWFANADVFPGLSMSVEEAADKIVEATRHRRSELIPTGLGRARMMIGAFLPELMLYTMGVMNRLMPSGISSMYRTGAQAQTESSYLSTSLKQAAEKAEQDNNQHEKSNPHFNLGLPRSEDRFGFFKN